MSLTINQHQARGGSKLSSLARAGQDILNTYGRDVGQKKFYAGRGSANDHRSSHTKSHKI